ncbi:MAG: glycosyltransferase family 2 protein [Erysipelotrichia bacterium]|nr:glycosyltransferase family 2 protein [Erysipelotrichia bacterium]
MKSLIIIPAYNESANVPSLIKNIEELGYDYIVINDCSTDQSADLYQSLNINYLNLPLNLGLANVTQVGFMYAVEHDYDAAVVVDGDGQHLPVYIKPLLDKVTEGYDYVIGSRFAAESKPWSMRMFGSRIICGIIKLKTGFKVTDPTSGMRAMGRKVLESFADNLNYVAEPDALCHILKKKMNVLEVQVEMEERQEGTSYFANPLKSVKFMFNVLMSILFIQ